MDSLKEYMKICICFTGLQRTIHQTHQNIVSQIINPKHEYGIIFVTWRNESTDRFLSIFPQACVHYIDEITIDNEEFQQWKHSFQMHISWRRTYESTYALFRYFQQIYLWRETARFLSNFKEQFDLFMRIRTDIHILKYPVHLSYETIEDNTLYFPSEPKHSIFNNQKGCPDYYFLGRPSVVIKALSILDYLHKYKIRYIEDNPKWFPVPTLEENIVQPESSMYIFLEGEKINIEFLDNSIEIIR